MPEVLSHFSLFHMSISNKLKRLAGGRLRRIEVNQTAT